MPGRLSPNVLHSFFPNTSIDLQTNSNSVFKAAHAKLLRVATVRLELDGANEYLSSLTPHACTRRCMHTLGNAHKVSPTQHKSHSNYKGIRVVGTRTNQRNYVVVGAIGCATAFKLGGCSKSASVRATSESRRRPVSITVPSRKWGSRPPSADTYFRSRRAILRSAISGRVACGTRYLPLCARAACMLHADKLAEAVCAPAVTLKSVAAAAAAAAAASSRRSCCQ